MNTPPLNDRSRAFKLYCAGHTQKQIAAEFGLSEKTIGTWKKQGQWEALRGPATLPGNIPAWAMRVMALLAEQQQMLGRMEAQLAALGSPPPADFPDSLATEKTTLAELAALTNMSPPP